MAVAAFFSKRASNKGLLLLGLDRWFLIDPDRLWLADLDCSHSFGAY